MRGVSEPEDLATLWLDPAGLPCVGLCLARQIPHSRFDVGPIVVTGRVLPVEEATGMRICHQGSTPTSELAGAHGVGAGLLALDLAGLVAAVQHVEPDNQTEAFALCVGRLVLHPLLDLALTARILGPGGVEIVPAE